MKLNWLPPLKSMPKLRPCQASETIPIRSTVAETANQVRRLPMKSIRCQPGIGFAVAPMNAGLSNQRKPESTPSIARVAATAVNIESRVPISSMSAKPLTPAVATAKRMNAVIIVTTFASTIVENPLR